MDPASEVEKNDFEKCIISPNTRGKALDEKLNILPLTENGNSIYFPVLIFL